MTTTKSLIVDLTIQEPYITIDTVDNEVIWSLHQPFKINSEWKKQAE